MTDAMYASEHAMELFSYLATNLRPTTIPDNEDNDMWMIADTLNNLPPNATSPFITTRLRLQTMLHVNPNKSGSVLRSITLNPDVMSAFAMLARYAEFRVQPDRAKIQPTGRVRLKPLAYFTGPVSSPSHFPTDADQSFKIFKIATQSSLPYMQMFSSTSLGDAPSTEEYNNLNDQEKLTLLQRLVESAHVELRDKRDNPPCPAMALMKHIDDCYQQYLRPIFLTHYGAQAGTEKFIAWQAAMDKYNNAITRVTDNSKEKSFMLSVRKRLFYLQHTPLFSFFSPQQVLTYDTPLPVFTRSVLQSWIQMLGRTDVKDTKTWHALRILCLAVCRLVFFQIHAIDGGPGYRHG